MEGRPTAGRLSPCSAASVHYPHRKFTPLPRSRWTRSRGSCDSLAGNGLATRQQDSADRRRFIVSLSAKGKRINAQIEEMIAAMEREFLIVLNRGERDTLYGLLDRLQSRGNQIFKVKQDWG